MHDYLAAWEARDSWKQSYYTPEQVVEGWKKRRSRIIRTALMHLAACCQVMAVRAMEAASEVH